MTIKCLACKAEFRWDDSMYRLCDECLWKYGHEEGFYLAEKEKVEKQRRLDESLRIGTDR